MTEDQGEKIIELLKLILAAIQALRDSPRY